MIVFPAGLQRCAPTRTKTSATSKNNPHATAVKNAMGAVVDPVATGAAVDPYATEAVGDLDAMGAVGDPAMESHRIASSKFIKFPQKWSDQNIIHMLYTRMSLILCRVQKALHGSFQSSKKMSPLPPLVSPVPLMNLSVGAKINCPRSRWHCFLCISVWLHMSHYNSVFVRVLCSWFFFHLVFHITIQDTLCLFNSPEVTLPRHRQ